MSKLFLSLAALSLTIPAFAKDDVTAKQAGFSYSLSGILDLTAFGGSKNEKQIDFRDSKGYVHSLVVNDSRGVDEATEVNLETLRKQAEAGQNFKLSLHCNSEVISFATNRIYNLGNKSKHCTLKKVK